VLYVITCATPAARDIGRLVSMAQERGWTVCVIATPLALRFIDVAALERQTGYPVRSDYKQPGTADVLPPATAMIVGASFNTINKWALGIADTLALGAAHRSHRAAAATGGLPSLNAAQAAHPAFQRSVAELRAAGVTVLLDAEGYEPHVPHTGSTNLPNYPWHKAVEALHSVEPITE
jgi:phosphopantothenoylcysteine synthetase/decarboxylase